VLEVVRREGSIVSCQIEEIDNPEHLHPHTLTIVAKTSAMTYSIGRTTTACAGATALESPSGAMDPSARPSGPNLCVGIDPKAKPEHTQSCDICRMGRDLSAGKVGEGGAKRGESGSGGVRGEIWWKEECWRWN
jgi:hypothetical protein